MRELIASLVMFANMKRLCKKRLPLAVNSLTREIGFKFPDIDAMVILAQQIILSNRRKKKKKKHCRGWSEDIFAATVIRGAAI
jgi:hypothetical protein